VYRLTTFVLFSVFFLLNFTSGQFFYNNSTLHTSLLLFSGEICLHLKPKIVIHQYVLPCSSTRLKWEATAAVLTFLAIIPELSALILLIIFYKERERSQLDKMAAWSVQWLWMCCGFLLVLLEMFADALQNGMFSVSL
jgi:hypothetical protein